MSHATILRSTTEEMANQCSVPMDIWDRHSNAALACAVSLDQILEAVGEFLAVRSQRPGYEYNPGKKFLDAEAMLSETYHKLLIYEVRK